MSETKIYKAAVIGLGRIGAGFDDNHCAAYKGCGRTKLVAVCDSEFSKAAKIADQLDCKSYVDFMSMVRAANPDIVSVCTPPNNHAFIVSRLAGMVKAIYCEKPIAENIGDAQAMIQTCRVGKTLLQINHQRRFLTPTFYYSRGIENTGTHMMDMLRELFGELCIFDAKHTDRKKDPNPEGLVITDRGLQIKIQPMDTDVPVFRFCPTEIGVNERPILNGVKHIVECLDNPCLDQLSSGEDGLAALKLVLRFKEIADGNKE